MRRIAIFEDSAARQFSPLALLRPVCELRCGHFTLRERLTESLAPREWGVSIRPELVETYAEFQPSASINDTEWLTAEPTLLINGRWLADPEFLRTLDPDTAGWIDDTLAYVVCEPGDPVSADPQFLAEDAQRLARLRKPVRISGTLLNYPWDLLFANEEWLRRDHQWRRKTDALSSIPSQVAIVGNVDDVFIHASARLDPFVVIDATSGPVWIDAAARIQAFTRLEGPCYIGRQTQLFRANIREGCSIGPVCRVGGEIEESIIHGFANKYHDGFLGHSYICPWVNLGALTTNSDLKNDYSEVKVPLSGQSLATGSAKVGCFIGDHTKTALCSLFNTGSAIGVMSLILPGGELLPKHVPSFSRIWHGVLEALPDGPESGLATARQAMSRREETLTPAMERLIRQVYRTTEAERTAALSRQATSRSPEKQLSSESTARSS